MEDSSAAHPANGLPPNNPLTHELNKGFMHRAVQHNYLYLISAALMLLAAYLLMYSPGITGEHFEKTIKALLVLQGYELLVIITAAFIVFHFKVLDDAFNLLLIEIVILLDPTFFSNHFNMIFVDAGQFTSNTGLLVNASCFSLAIAKFLILLFALRLNLAPRGWLAFVFAAFFTYLAEAPLVEDFPIAELSRSDYHYLLCWAPLLFAFIMPPTSELIQPSKKGLSKAPEGSEFISSERANFLNYALLAIPLFIITAHITESAIGYTLAITPIHITAWVLALGLLLCKNWKKETSTLVYLLDGIIVVCFLLNLLSLKNDMQQGLLDTIFLLTFWGATAIGLYGYCYWRYNYRPALYRIVAMVLLGCCISLYQAAFFKNLLNSLWVALSHLPASLADLISGNVYIIFGFLLIGSIVLAIKYSNGFTWFLVGLMLVGLIFSFIPDKTEWAPEAIQFLILLALVLDYHFNPEGNKSHLYFFASIMVAIGTIRFFDNPTTWSFGVVAVEFTFLIGYGFLTRIFGYVVIGSLQLLLFIGYFAVEAELHHSPELLVLFAALALFAIAVVITFNKDKAIQLAELFQQKMRTIIEIPEMEEPAENPYMVHEYAEHHPTEAPSATQEPDNEQSTAPKPGEEAATQPDNVPAVEIAEEDSLPHTEQMKHTEEASDEECDMPAAPLETMPTPLEEAPPEAITLPAAPPEHTTEAPKATPLPLDDHQLPPSAIAQAGSLAQNVDMGQLLKALFIVERSAGIYHIDDLPERYFSNVSFELEKYPDDTPLIFVVNELYGKHSWRVVLTDRRVIYTEDKETTEIAYGQIAGTSDYGEILYLNGYVGQAVMLPGLNKHQRACLKKGLDIVRLCH